MIKAMEQLPYKKSVRLELNSLEEMVVYKIITCTNVTNRFQV